ncbi:MAG TPA: hypothetical protein VGM03_10620 [Phycisphaerae bacterium]|jgi:hypothetical protein
MVAQAALDPKVEEPIRRALESMLSPGRPHRIEVFRSTRPFLRAIVVSDDFEQMGASQRQDFIWSRLRTTALDAELLNRLWGVHPYTWSEFKEEFDGS